MPDQLTPIEVIYEGFVYKRVIPIMVETMFLIIKGTEKGLITNAWILCCPGTNIILTGFYLFPQASKIFTQTYH